MNGIVPGSIEHEELLLKTKDWKVLYPIYFDKKVSRAGGRKVSKEIAIDTPDVEDLIQMLSYLKIPMVVEMNKRHPRDHFCLGRVRYQLKDESGKWANKDIQNKFALYKKCGEMIPKLKNRKSENRLDIVRFKPQNTAGPGKKVKKIKGGKKKRRR